MSSSFPIPRLELVLEDIPVEYRDRFEDLLGADGVAPELLRSELDAYLAMVHRVSPLVAFLDAAVADRIGGALHTLIGMLRPDQDPLVHDLVQASTRYFVLEEEDEEVTGVLGFDDDIQVVNAVCRALQRADLCVPLQREEP